VKEKVDEDNDSQLEMTERISEEDEVIANFVLTPTRDDCGKFIRCAAVQGDFFHDQPQIISRQINVVFPPQENTELIKANYSQEIGDPVEIKIEFESHPHPEASQVIWHLGDDLSISPDQLVADGGLQYVAHLLEFDNENEDLVIAKLTIHHLSLEEANQDFYLEARNKFSDEPT